MIKILIIRLSSIGDIIHTFPMVFDIKNNVKNCTIDWLVDESFIDIVKLNCNVDNVIGIPIRKLKTNKFNIVSSVMNWRKSIKSVEYDYIIDSQGLIKSALVSKFFRGDVYGFDKNSIREKLACIFYKFKISVNNTLAINKNRQLSAAIFNYNIDDSKVDFGLTKCTNLAKDKLFTKDYIVIFHSSSKKNKHYDIENWLTIIQHVVDRYNMMVILPYGNSTEKIESLKMKNSLANYANMIIVPEEVYSFSQLASLIYNASFILGVDTGLVHLANAFNKNTIAIYIATDPTKTGIFAAENAKNIGNIGNVPCTDEVIQCFDNIIK